MIPLADAVLCEDCQLIGYQKNGRCEFCGSQALIWLQPILEPEAFKRDNGSKKTAARA